MHSVVGLGAAWATVRTDRLLRQLGIRRRRPAAVDPSSGLDGGMPGGMGAHRREIAGPPAGVGAAQPGVRPHGPERTAGERPDPAADRSRACPASAPWAPHGRAGRSQAPGAEPDSAGEDGVVLRRLGPDHMPEVERLLLALGPADRRMRFLSPFEDGVISAYVRRIDPDTVFLVGAIEDRDGGLLGLAEAHPSGAPGRVEVAVSVRPAHRRRGLGGRLVAQALALAFGAGADTAEFAFDPENRAIVGLAASLGARFGPSLGRAEIRRHG